MLFVLNYLKFGSNFRYHLIIFLSNALHYRVKRFHFNFFVCFFYNLFIFFFLNSLVKNEINFRFDYLFTSLFPDCNTSASTSILFSSIPSIPFHSNIVLNKRLQQCGNKTKKKKMKTKRKKNLQNYGIIW